MAASSPIAAGELGATGLIETMIPIVAWLAVPAERRSLEEIAKPSTSAREGLTATAWSSKMCCPGP